MSEDEFASKYLGLLPLSGDVSRRKRQPSDDLKCSNISSAKDWRNFNIVPSVKDQKECGSCYIFSSTGAVESAVNLEYGISSAKISRQNSLNCLLDPTINKTNGCLAGRPEWLVSEPLVLRLFG